MLKSLIMHKKSNESSSAVNFYVYMYINKYLNIYIQYNDCHKNKTIYIGYLNE